MKTIPIDKDIAEGWSQGLAWNLTVLAFSRYLLRWDD